MPTPFPDDVRGFIESTAWTFAKTYAATWPHEYVVRTPQNAAMVVALARHIFEHGVDGRFYSQVRKYHHEAGKVYWSMDDAPEGTGLVKLASERRLRRLGMLTLGQVLLLALAETNPFFFATIPLQVLLARHEWKKMAPGAPPEAARDLAGRLQRRHSARSAREVRVAGDVAR
jgi:hypothetical protein